MIKFMIITIAKMSARVDFNDLYRRLLPISTKWAQLAALLNFDGNNIDRIRIDNPDEERRLIAMCHEWTQRNPHGSWDDVEKAIAEVTRPSLVHTTCSCLPSRFCCIILLLCCIILLVLALIVYTPLIAHNMLGKDLQHRVLSHPFTEECLSALQTGSTENVPVNELVINSIKQFEDDYLFLLSKMQVILDQKISNDTILLKILGRYLCNRFGIDYQPVEYQEGKDQIDTLFQRVKQFFNFMDTSLLKNIDQKFLKSYFLYEIEGYDKSVIDFAASVLVTELAEIVRSTHANIKKEGILIVLKLGHNWDNQTHKSLNHLVNHVFGNDSSLMRLICIHRSLLTVLYALPRTLYHSAIKSITGNRKILKLAGVISVRVNETLFTLVEKPTSKKSSSKIHSISMSLFDALQNFRNINDLKLLIAIGADINYISDTGSTPLTYAVQLDNLGAIRALLELHANPDIVDGNGGTPLMFAAYSNKVAVAEQLLDFNADPDVHSYLLDATALITATSKGFDLFVRLLLLYNADPNKQTNDGLAPLHVASHKGFLSCAQVLLEYGALPNIEDPYGKTSLEFASLEGRCEVVSLLLRNSADPYHRIKGFSSLHFSAYYGYSDCVYAHLESGVDPNIQTDYGFTALHFASDQGHISVVKVLLSSGARVDVQSNDDDAKICLSLFSVPQKYQGRPISDPLLQDYSPSGITPLMAAVSAGRTDVVKLLLDHGSNPNMCFRGLNSLGVAAFNGHLEIVKLLLEHNAVLDIYGTIPPLFLAIDNNHLDVVATLIDADANINKSFNSLTPLMVAATRGNIELVHVLLNARADVTRRNKHGDTVLDVVKALLQDTFDFNSHSLEHSSRYLKILKLLSREQDSHSDTIQSNTIIASSFSVYELLHEVKYKMKETDKSNGQEIISHVQLSIDHMHSEFKAIVNVLMLAITLSSPKL